MYTLRYMHAHLSRHTDILTPTIVMYTYPNIRTHTLTHTLIYTPSHVVISHTDAHTLIYTYAHSLSQTDNLAHIYSHTLILFLTYTSIQKTRTTVMSCTHTYTVSHAHIPTLKLIHTRTHTHTNTYRHIHLHLDKKTYTEQKLTVKNEKKNSQLTFFSPFPLILARSLVGVGYERIGTARRK